MKENKNLITGLLGVTLAFAVLYFSFRVAGAGWAKGSESVK